MERIKELNRYQKVILILLAALLVGFTVLYAVTSARVGYEYNGHILVPRAENGSTVYENKNTAITVTADKTVIIEMTIKSTAPIPPERIPLPSLMTMTWQNT